MAASNEPRRLHAPAPKPSRQDCNYGCHSLNCWPVYLLNRRARLAAARTKHIPQNESTASKLLQLLPVAENWCSMHWSNVCWWPAWYSATVPKRISENPPESIRAVGIVTFFPERQFGRECATDQRVWRHVVVVNRVLKAVLALQHPRLLPTAVLFRNTRGGHIILTTWSVAFPAWHVFTRSPAFKLRACRRASIKRVGRRSHSCAQLSPHVDDPCSIGGSAQVGCFVV